MLNRFTLLIIFTIKTYKKQSSTFFLLSFRDTNIHYLAIQNIVYQILSESIFLMCILVKIFFYLKIRNFSKIHNVQILIDESCSQCAICIKLKLDFTSIKFNIIIRNTFFFLLTKTNIHEHYQLQESIISVQVSCLPYIGRIIKSQVM